MSKTTIYITDHIKSKLSNTAAQIVAANTGYRNDFLFDGDDHQILAVIAYEHAELGNDDIFNFIKKSYHIDIVKQPDAFKIWLAKVFQTDVNNLFGYWLTSQESCLDLYVDTLDDEITKLTLPNDYLILADLSVDGCLIVTNQPKSDNELVQMNFVRDIKSKQNTTRTHLLGKHSANLWH